MTSRTHYLCIGSQCWGMATNTGAAVSVAKRNWPGLGRGAGHFAHDVWHVTESTYVDYLGMIRCDAGDLPPLKLREVRFDGAGKRKVRLVGLTASEIQAAAARTGH